MYHNPYKVYDCCIFYEPLSRYLGKYKMHNIHVAFDDWCSKFSVSKCNDSEDNNDDA